MTYRTKITLIRFHKESRFRVPRTEEYAFRLETSLLGDSVSVCSSGIGLSRQICGDGYDLLCFGDAMRLEVNSHYLCSSIAYPRICLPQSAALPLRAS